MTTTTATYGPTGSLLPAPSVGASSTSGASSDSSSTSSTTGMSADQNMFLKLLVAQMQNQDPNNSTDPTTFLTQTAEFTTVEKLDTVATLSQQVYNSSLQQTAVSMIGQNVSYTDVSGATQTGKVTGVSIGAATPNLTINGTSVSLDTVTAVGTPPPTAATPTPGTSSG